MTCPCLVPLLDHRAGSPPIIFFPNDWDEPTDATFEEVTHDGKRYMMVLYRNPSGHKLKEYPVNDHLAYAGCASVEGGKLRCEHKSLFYVLHPIKEWSNYHVLK